jgi:hypothetical protein
MKRMVPVVLAAALALGFAGQASAHPYGPGMGRGAYGTRGYGPGARGWAYRPGVRMRMRERARFRAFERRHIRMHMRMRMQRMGGYGRAV